MTDNTPTVTLAQAAAMVAEAELATLKSLQTEAGAFRAKINEILSGLTLPAGYSSNPRRIAQSMLSAVAFPLDNEIPQLIQSYGAGAP
jgi:hypothetical protein